MSSTTAEHIEAGQPRVLILSTRFVPALQQFQRVLERRKTALLVLAEENDQSAYMDWLRAHGIVYRSINEPALVDAVRRVARGELFVQQSISDGRRYVRGCLNGGGLLLRWSQSVWRFGFARCAMSACQIDVRVAHMQHHWRECRNDYAIFF